MDCRSNDPDECDNCSAEGSCAEDCDKLDPNTSAVCELPSAWDCPEEFYGDGECDCGCLALDIDCASNSVDVCLYSWCTDDIAAGDNTQCD